MSVLPNYISSEVEQKWYSYWLKNKYFSSKPDHREPYTIVIPPPNITGVLHMGHMLNNTIQDILIRRARLQGKNACWVPGTDHASIATEAKVVDSLKKQGIVKEELDRETFLKHAWEWKDNYGGIILDQLKKLGCSCDWDRTKFTMDDDMSKSVISTFIDLHNKGLIYKGYRMVNWDPEARTTLSDEEVNYVERKDNLYYIKYKIENDDNYITIATTRPETILGDSAICVNPNDNRFHHLRGKQIIVPLCNRLIPVIEDDYVDIEFGTGCLKVTPAHDLNDKLIGERHNLEVIDILNDDATLNKHGLEFEGKDRFIARKEIIEKLTKLGLVDKIEQISHNVGISERTSAIIEPKFSDQWFLKMEELVKPAIKSVLQDKEIKLFPKKFENTYKHWLENIRDWNISRQLYWGQQIPAYYYGKGKNDYVVATNIQDALSIAIKTTKNKNLKVSDLKQESDVLDTWFSSWLWPISVFDGVNNPDNDEINYYYPTNDLVTGPDILFFWVARMIIAGYEFKKTKPFSNIYLTGLVRDKQRRKMSKSLGNSPDALELIKDYGADSVRVGLLLSASAGNDLMFDESLCKQGKSFSNKIWNSYKLINGWSVEDIQQPEYSKLSIQWYENKFQSVLVEIEDHFNKYRLSDALMCIYKLIWDDFCSWLLELIKPGYQQPIDKLTFDSIINIFENNLRILHPFMPFISEEIWQNITKRSVDNALIVSDWPKVENIDISIIKDFDFTSQVISSIRTIRKEKSISFKNSIELHVLNNENMNTNLDSLIIKLCNISKLVYTKNEVENSISFRVKSNNYYVPVNNNINVDEEIIKLKTELSYTEGFLNSVRKKLSNTRFVENAPEKVIQIEKDKEQDALSKIKAIKDSLRSFEG
ncbi:valine--tRNA ligase [Flavobacteriaceae bacterium]|nr:valine--tRNA ligase [Flavobacteriaceae bacterium]